MPKSYQFGHAFLDEEIRDKIDEIFDNSTFYTSSRMSSNTTQKEILDALVFVIQLALPVLVNQLSYVVLSQREQAVFIKHESKYLKPDDHSKKSELISKLDGYFGYYKGLLGKTNKSYKYFKNIHKQTTFDYVYENEKK